MGEPQDLRKPQRWRPVTDAHGHAWPDLHREVAGVKCVADFDAYFDVYIDVHFDAFLITILIHLMTTFDAYVIDYFIAYKRIKLP